MSWLHDARLVGLQAVAGALGHPVDRRGARCPLCGHEDACKAFTATRWHCHACDVGGDAVDLVCAVLTGERYGRQHIDTVRAWYAAQGWCEAYGAPGDSVPVRVRVAPPPVPVEPEVSYPPADELLDLLAQTVSPLDDAAVARWICNGRGFGPEAPARLAYAGVRALPPGARCPEWAAMGKRTWAELDYRCLFPQVDAEGAVRSVRARCVGAVPWEGAPKALPPRGHRVAGAVAANRPAGRMLRDRAPMAEVVVVEGEPQWMAACLRWSHAAVLGIVAGSWSEALAARVTPGALVTVVTDHNDARGTGDKYAETVASTLKRCRVVRHEGVL